MACLMADAMRLEKRKELNEYTWHAMRFSATLESAAQAGELGSMRVGVGYHARPRNKAKVKSELTLTIPSSAIMWMVVLLIMRRLTVDVVGGNGAEERGGEKRNVRGNMLLA